MCVCARYHDLQQIRVWTVWTTLTNMLIFGWEMVKLPLAHDSKSSRKFYKYMFHVHTRSDKRHRLVRNATICMFNRKNQQKIIKQEKSNQNKYTNKHQNNEKKTINQPRNKQKTTTTLIQTNKPQEKQTDKQTTRKPRNTHTVSCFFWTEGFGMLVAALCHDIDHPGRDVSRFGRFVGFVAQKVRLV